MSEDNIHVRVEFEQAKSRENAIEGMVRDLGKLKKQLDSLKSIANFSPSKKDLESFKAVNDHLKSLKQSANGSKTATRDLNKAIKNGESEAWLKRVVTKFDAIQKSIKKGAMEGKKLSKVQLADLNRYIAATEKLKSVKMEALKAEGKIADKEASIARARANHNLQNLRAIENRQKAEHRAAKASAKAMSAGAGSSTGNTWGKDNNAHVAIYKSIRRQEEKQNKEFWKQQRFTITRMDRSENLEKRRLKNEEMAARRIVREREIQRRSFRNSMSSAGHHARESVMSMSHPFFSSPAFAAEAALTSALVGLTEVIRATKPFDKAMTDLSIRGDMSRSQAEARGRDALSNAIDFGVAPEHFVNIEKEAAARGLPAELAKGLGPMIMKFAEATGQRPEQASEHTSEFIQQLMSMGRLGKGAAIKDNIFKTLNATAVIANKFGTPEKMMQAMESGLAERGAELNLNPQDTVTLAGLMNSSGARTGQFTTRAMGLLSKGAPNWKAEWMKKLDSMDDPRSRAFVNAPQKMGYSGIDAMASDAHGDNGLKGILRFFESFKNIENATERKMIEEQLGFTEQLAGIVTGMSESGDKLKRAQSESGTAYNENDDDKSYLSRAQKKYRFGLEYMLGVLSTGFETMAISIGEGLRQKVISKILGPWQQLSHWAVDNLPAVINQVIDSFMDGLGYKAFTDRLGEHNGVQMFVDSITQSVKSTDWGALAKDVGSAVKGIGEGLVTLKNDFVYAFGWLSKITGGDGSVETLAKLTTEVFGFALALHALSPVIGILTSITSAFKFLGDMLSSMKALRALSGAGAVAGEGGMLAAGMATLPITIAAIAAGTLLAVTIMNWDAIKSWFVGDKQDKSARGRILENVPPAFRGDPSSYSRFLTPEQMKELAAADAQSGKGPLRHPLSKPSAGLKGFSDYAPISYGGGDFHSLISKASYTPSDSGEVIKDSVVGTESGVVAVKNEIQVTNYLLKLWLEKSLTGDGSGGDGSGGGGGGGGGGGTPGSRNMRYGSGGFTPSGGRIGKAQQNKNSAAVMEELKKAGFKPNAIAAIMGSMQTESSFNPGITNSSGHHGLWQWDGRKRWPKIAAWIKSHGGDPNDAAWQTKAWVAEHTAKPGDAIYDGAQTSRAGAILKGDPSLGEAMGGVKMSERYDHEAGRGANARGWLGVMDGSASKAGNLGGVAGKMVQGLRLKSAEAVAGGNTNPAILAMAKNLQDKDIPGGIKNFTAFDDAYHHKLGYHSAHVDGMAGDAALNDPRQHAAAAEAVRKRFGGLGLSPKDYKVIDEYAHPSGAATGGHIHFQFNSPEAAAKALGQMKSPDEIAKKVPSKDRPAPREDGGGSGGQGPRMDSADAGGGRGGHTFHMAFHSNVTDHHALARAVSQQIEQTVATRTHDVDHDVS